MPNVEDLKRQLAEAQAEEARQARHNTQTVIPTFPNPHAVQQPQQADPYAPVVWGASEYDFTTPSGQRCRLRKLPIEQLATTGILDQITRLPGLTAELVAKSSGMPPTPTDVMPDTETVKSVIEVVNQLVPIAVVRPEILPVPAEGEERLEGRIYVDSIELMDRVAIMNRVISPLQKLDAFRNES